MSINIGVNIQRSPNRINQALRAAGVNGQYPKLLFDFDDEYYLTNGSSKTFANAMTFARAGNATMVDSDGKIKWAPHNLLGYSNTFDDAVWDLGLSSTLTTDYAASPSGEIDASRLQFPASGGTFFSQAPIFTAGITYTFSIWAKATSADSQFSIYENTSGAAIQSPRKTATNEWQLFTFEFTASNTGSNAVGLNNENDSYATDILIYGAHLYRSDLGGMVNNPDRGDSYVPTTSSAVYLPRRGHHKYNGDQWVNKGILVESEARTNLVDYSSDFTNASWTKNNCTITANDATSPDGNQNADAIVETATTGFHSVTHVARPITSGVKVTGSCLVKASGRTQAFLAFTGYGNFVGTPEAYFDLSSGTVVSAGNSTIAKITKEGNDWYRISITCEPSATTTSSFFISPALSGAASYLGVAGTKAIHVYNAQMEAGSTPSSYIPTNGATVTRAAETVTVPYANLPWPTPTYIGDELVTNGTFDTDSDWSKGGDWAIGGGVAYKSGGSGGSIIQSHAVEVGKIYEISFTVTSYTGGDILVYADGTYINISDSAGYKSIAYVATDTLLGFGVYGNSGSNFAVDNISVREINPLSVSIAMMGEMNYADNDETQAHFFFLWESDSNNRIRTWLDTSSTSTGHLDFNQASSGVVDIVSSSNSIYSPDLNVPFNIASRHGSTFLNGAVNGIALTADTTPVALPDLSTTDLNLAYDFNGTISEFRIWDKDIQDAGLEAATAPSLEPSLSLTFDGQPSSYTNSGLTV